MPVATTPRSPSPDRPAKKLKLDADADPSSEPDEHALVEGEMALPIEFPKTYKNEIDYRNKLVLAPMVRSGSRECLVRGFGE
jgi:tRNA-dihydrouridine synthase 2